jgi:hypothetical protein
MARIRGIQTRDCDCVDCEAAYARWLAWLERARHAGSPAWRDGAPLDAQTVDRVYAEGPRRQEPR